MLEGKQPEHLRPSYFIEPTVFADVSPDMTIAEKKSLVRFCAFSHLIQKKMLYVWRTKPYMVLPQGSGRKISNVLCRWFSKSKPELFDYGRIKRFAG
jgi:hypothetical protein